MWLTILTSKWTWIAIAFAALAAWGTFWKWDAGRWEDKYETFAAQVRAEGLVAEAKAKETEAAQDKATKEIANDSKKRRNSVVARFSGSRNPTVTSVQPDSGGSSVPAASVDPGKPNAATAEQVPSGRGITVQSCALDAEQVLSFQEWVKKEKIPVR